jgi:hypothetical protein
MPRRSQLQMFRPLYFGRVAPDQSHPRMVVGTSGQLVLDQSHRRMAVGTSGQVVPVRSHHHMVVGTFARLARNWR